MLENPDEMLFVDSIGHDRKKHTKRKGNLATGRAIGSNSARLQRPRQGLELFLAQRAFAQPQDVVVRIRRWQQEPLGFNNLSVEICPAVSSIQTQVHVLFCFADLANRRRKIHRRLRTRRIKKPRAFPTQLQSKFSGQSGSVPPLKKQRARNENKKKDRPDRIGQFIVAAVKKSKR
ncbi:hypothetical protein [Aliiroseovarius sp.]|uniref:hypothetical protein n=1 Tax=Aliiroseovarius sp. TaxID=1872442 RepID=UPI003BAC8275